MPYVGWEQAWERALYGPDGFFRRPDGSARHFRTCATSPGLARALARLAAELDLALGEPEDFTVLDLGSGRGELLAGLAACSPARWRLMGVDLRARPARLPARVEWSGHPPDAVRGLLIAHEFLDAVPCPVVECDEFGDVRIVLVDVATGSEQLGPLAPPEAQEWLRRWWPLDPGQRAEVGIPREEKWRSLVGTLTAGLALAVDYSHSADDRAGDAVARGTLAGYRDGARVPPVPDGSCDLTAHVALDACACATRDGGWTLLTRQAEVLGALGVTAELPSLATAASDPRTYAADLAAAADARVLLDPLGPGAFGWLLHGRGLPPPGMMRT
jgi:SAM-dependent MidA family methyltransferase